MIDNRPEEQRRHIRGSGIGTWTGRYLFFAGSYKFVTLLCINAVVAVASLVGLGYAISESGTGTNVFGLLAASLVYFLLGAIGFWATLRQSLVLLLVYNITNVLFALAHFGLVILCIVRIATYEPDKDSDSYHLYYVVYGIVLTLSAMVMVAHGIAASFGIALRRSILRQCEVLK
ncbi:MAG: hypothetical protein MHM6MM_006965 [Cercozoa sp. M6MM]